MAMNNFNLARMVLATSVLLSHSFALAGSHEPIVFHQSLGAFAVHCFFVISGYLITSSAVSSPSIGRYCWKRILRLVPALVVAYIISMYLHGQFNAYETNPVPWIANGSLWTLSWEAACYALVALAAALGLLTPATIGSIYAIGMVLILFGISGAIGTQTVGPNLMFLFLAGAFIKVSGASISLKKLGLLSTFVLLAMHLPGVSPFVQEALSRIPFVFGPDLSYDDMRLFVYFVCLPFAVLYLCTMAPVVPFIRGDYSYGIYVYAWPVQQITVWYALAKWGDVSGLTVFVVSMICTLLLAFLSWHLIEKSALKLKDVRFWSANTTSRLKPAE